MSSPWSIIEFHLYSPNSLFFDSTLVLVQPPTHPLDLIMMNNASLTRITATAGTRLGRDSYKDNVIILSLVRILVDSSR